jgi:hypothetical protein
MTKIRYNYIWQLQNNKTFTTDKSLLEEFPNLYKEKQLGKLEITNPFSLDKKRWEFSSGFNFQTLTRSKITLNPVFQDGEIKMWNLVFGNENRFEVIVFNT